MDATVAVATFNAFIQKPTRKTLADFKTL